MLELTQRLLSAAEGGAPVVLISVIDPGPLKLVHGARMLVELDGERMGSLGSAALDDAAATYAGGAFERHAAETVYFDGERLSPRFRAGAAAVYLEVVEARPVFLVVGAGHIGQSLARLAAMLSFQVAVIDDRDDMANAERFPEADDVICADYEEALDQFPITSNTTIVLVTRGHKQDELSLRHCLGRGAGYLGMIGSKRRTGAVLQHLRDDGFDADELAKVRTPIGLDIGAETPEEIAIAIMAEVIMLRRGGTSKPMYHRRPTHAPGPRPNPRA